MRALAGIGLVVLALCNLSGYAAAEEQLTGAPAEVQQAADYVEVSNRSVDEQLYFYYKSEGKPLNPADSRELLKQKGHQLQLALERWAVAHDISAANPTLAKGQRSPSYYPYDLESLVRSKLLERLDGKGYYANPYTSWSRDVWDAANVAPGDWSWNPAKAGNFSYVYRCNEDGYVVGYELVFYGATADDGYDLNQDGAADGVIMHLASGTQGYQDAPAFWNGQLVQLP